MNATTLAYIAGFLDGDGSIFLQLVRRKDYIYGFQIRCSIAFYQKSSHAEILDWLKSQLKYGYIRHRKTGVSDYTIVGPKEVQEILERLKPYVRLKKPHVELGLQILADLPKASTAGDFLKLCRSVDHFSKINYSKKRPITSEVVERHLKELFITPVETSSEMKEVLNLRENS